MNVYFGPNTNNMSDDFTGLSITGDGFFSVDSYRDGEYILTHREVSLDKFTLYEDILKAMIVEEPTPVEEMVNNFIKATLTDSRKVLCLDVEDELVSFMDVQLNTIDVPAHLSDLIQLPVIINDTLHMPVEGVVLSRIIETKD